MRLFLPPPPPGQGYLALLVRQLTIAFTNVVSSDQAQPRIILQSFDPVTGAPTKSWNVTVDSTGALHTTENTGMINAAGGHPP